jgi:hypothetical protein
LICIDFTKLRLKPSVWIDALDCIDRSCIATPQPTRCMIPAPHEVGVGGHGACNALPKRAGASQDGLLQI